jgi:hypothetical protein
MPDWSGWEYAGMYWQQEPKLWPWVFSMISRFAIVVDDDNIIVELRTPAMPVGIGGGKERGGCHLNLRT